MEATAVPIEPQTLPNNMFAMNFESDFCCIERLKRNIGQQNWTNICVFKKSESLSTLIYLNAKSKVEKMINWAIKNRSENVIRKIIFRVKVAARSPSFFLSFLV